MTIQTAPKASDDQAGRLNQLFNQVGRNWLKLFNILFAIFFGVPWLAPVFMNWGWESAAQAIYFIYSPLCHQFPQRSYFLFGDQAMYSLDDIAKVWPNTTNPLELRQFIGTPEMGWKIAWSDRMVSMYGGILIGSLLVSAFQNWIKQISLWWLPIVMIPMGVDGLTHAVSDLFGFQDGFRYHNSWLGSLTGQLFEQAFYVGNAIGSFNWWMRLLSGLIFGIGITYIILSNILNSTNSK